jgi:hypothetical protein
MASAYGSVVKRATYRYELRRGAAIVATGHVTIDEPLEVGQSISIGKREGVIETIEPLLRDRELRIVVRLPDDSQR